jgi:hypothetical protein
MSLTDLRQEEVGKLSAVRAKFEAGVQQLAGVSEAFYREGVDFLMGLLHPDPGQRLTTEQALRHPFLVSDILGGSQDDLPPKVEKRVLVPENTFERKLFAACSKMCGLSDDEEVKCAGLEEYLAE